VILGDAHKELIALNKILKAPVTNTLMGLGAYPAADKYFMGMLGMHGTYQANMAMHNADVILAIGARFDDLGRLVSGSIVNDDQFDAWIGLCLHAHQCFAHVLRVVV